MCYAPVHTWGHEMQISRSKILAPCLLGLLLVSCSRGVQPPAPSPAPRQQAQRRPAPAPVSSSAYFASAAAIDLFEIRSSELALQRSSSQRVREFASMM